MQISLEPFRNPFIQIDVARDAAGKQTGDYPMTNISSTIWNAPMPDPNYDDNQKAREQWFNIIADKNNWKNPIRCWIGIDELEDCNQASIFFTGAPLKVEKISECICLVTSPGYYATIGA